MPNMVTPVRLPPGRLRLVTRPAATGSPLAMKTTGIVCVAALTTCGELAAGCSDYGDLTAHQIGRQRWKAIIVTLGPTVFDLNVLVLHEPSFFQTLTKLVHDICRHVAR